MKKLLLICSLLTCVYSCMAQEKKEVEMTYLHKIPLNELNKAGNSQKFIQLCTTDVDSVVQGRINFIKASINSINDCKMSMRIIKDTLRDYYVETRTMSNTVSLIKEVNKVYGLPLATDSLNGELIYHWKEDLGWKQVRSSLTISANKKKGVLKSKEEPK